MKNLSDLGVFFAHFGSAAATASTGPTGRVGPASATASEAASQHEMLVFTFADEVDLCSLKDLCRLLIH